MGLLGAHFNGNKEPQKNCPRGRQERSYLSAFIMEIAVFILSPIKSNLDIFFIFKHFLLLQKNFVAQCMDNTFFFFFFQCMRQKTSTGNVSSGSLCTEDALFLAGFFGGNAELAFGVQGIFRGQQIWKGQRRSRIKEQKSNCDTCP